MNANVFSVDDEMSIVNCAAWSGTDAYCSFVSFFTLIIYILCIDTIVGGIFQTLCKQSR